MSRANLIETIIVGAGPAGLTVGRYLKDAVILEQKKEIGKPVQCAEGINKESLEKQEIKPDPPWISAIIDDVEVFAPSGKVIRIKGKELGFILDRTTFEKYLSELCQAKIKLQTKVVDIAKEKNFWKVITEDGKILNAKYLIGADGPTSIVRRKIFKEKVSILPSIEYLVKLEREINPSLIKMYFDKERLPNGYAWIFPKSKYTANIGLGGKKHIDQRLNDFMERIVKKEFGNYELLENRSGAIPYGGAKIKLFRNNAFLVGDAGALVDPIFGGGISNAMISGRLAAECILSGTPQLYEGKIKSMKPFSTDLLLAQKILYSLPNPVLNQLAEVLDKKDIFYLKTFSGLLNLFRKPHLRKYIFQIYRFFYILQKNSGSFI